MRLLVSARDADEVSILQRLSVDIIDMKEPARGSLGAVSKEELGKTDRILKDETVSSVAYGELIDWDGRQHAFLKRQQFAKIGLAGVCRDGTDWRAKWTTWLQLLPVAIQGVAVIYADFESCDAPHPSAMIQEARNADCNYILLDTFDKSRGGLLEAMSMERVQDLILNVHDRGMKFAIAGSLNAERLDVMAALRPDIFAVRGSVCRDGDRKQPIDAERVIQLVSDLEPFRSHLCESSVLNERSI